MKGRRRASSKRGSGSGGGPGRGAPAGSAYIIMLGASLLVAVLGIGALTAARTRRAADEVRISGFKAKLVAEAGIEVAMDAIANDANWRTTYSNGTWIASRLAGDGRFSVDGTDPVDGNLANNVNDQVDLVSTGVAGAARQKIKVSLLATPNPYSCLGVALCSGGAQTHTGTTITCNQTLASSLTITGVLADVTGDVEATAVVGTLFRGSTTILATVRQFPNASTVFSQYASGATSISWGSIPTVSSKKTISRVALSSAVNPFGATNASGMYVIDCAGNDLYVKDLRVVGTLILLNAGSGTTFSGSINWAPSASDKPALLVQGSCTFSFSGSTPLAETGTTSVNFNPAGMAYLGATDSDTLDSYPSQIQGLAYVSGGVTTSGDPKFVGVLVAGGAVSTSGTLTLTYDATVAGNPPAGFANAPVMKVKAGSWEQVVD